MIVNGAGHKKGRMPEKEVVALALADLSEQKKVCELKGDQELVGIIENADPKFVHKRDLDKQLEDSNSPSVWVYELVGDYLRSKRLFEERYVYGLYQALYGVVTDSYLSWYMSAPLNSADVSFANYFELWKSGADYFLTHDEILIGYVY